MSTLAIYDVTKSLKFIDSKAVVGMRECLRIWKALSNQLINFIMEYFINL